jgi:hypothetical protein
LKETKRYTGSTLADEMQPMARRIFHENVDPHGLMIGRGELPMSQKEGRGTRNLRGF